MSVTLLLRRAEFVFLVGLAVFLPALEAPKNICLGFFLIFWLLNRLRSREWGGRSSAWDSLIVALIGSAYLAAYFAGLPGGRIAAGNDILSYGLVFMAVRRTRFDARQVWWLLGALVVATLLTLAYGYWGYLVTHERKSLGLHSVGHVNHSAIYMAIVFCVALAVASVSQVSRLQRLALWSCTLVLFVSVLVTVARGAIIPMLLFLAFWMYHWRVRRLGLSPFKFVGMAVIAVVLALIVRPEIIQKTVVNIERGDMGSYRPALARTAILAVREYPLFGVGPSQFGKITPELAETWQSEHGKWFEQDNLYFASHAHGLYFNTLAERGLLGLAILLTLLAAWGVALKRGMQEMEGDAVKQMLWGSALGAWALTVFGGFFNTTLHHEHAMITALLMALWMSWQRNPTVSE